MQQTIESLYEGKLNPLEAVMLADKELRGIRAIILRQGITLETAERRVSIPAKGLDKRQQKKLAEFAALAYWKARKNGSIRPGEVHLGKGLSTKHYGGAFRDYTNTLLAKYSC